MHGVFAISSLLIFFFGSRLGAREAFFALKVTYPSCRGDIGSPFLLRTSLLRSPCMGSSFCQEFFPLGVSSPSWLGAPPGNPALSLGLFGFG